MHQIFIDGETLTIEDIVKVSREYAKVVLKEEAKKRVKRSREVLEKLVKEGKVIYGVNTGFGALSNVRISPSEIRKLQLNLIRSHSTGVDEPLDTETIRAMMLLRANTLAKGYSGVRLEVLETLIEMLNKRVHPIVPSKGSVGASGDLTPLSHMILVLIGEGKAEYQGAVMNGEEAMKRAKIKPVQLEAKEGIALNNGTQLMTAIAALAVYDAEKLVQTAEAAAALTVEALLGIIDAFDEKIHKVRPHSGQVATAANLRRLLEGSRLAQTSEEALKKGQRPQDAYSLRCTPQVLGTARDAIAQARKVIETEANSATDNPLIFPETEKCLSGGNFHGQPLSFALDTLGIALAIVGNMSERRVARLIDDKLNNGLPAFLIPPQKKAGLNSGLMTTQYTAAALASENKILAHPACIDTIPTSANFEDFVSMGATAAHKTRKILENTQYIIAIELLCATQALALRGPERMGKETRKIYEKIRKEIPKLTEDQPLSEEIEKIKQMIKTQYLTNIDPI
ncbi:MAG: histidine ammonia-lyase [Candidatus Bathyarchaeia archaeon]